MDRGQQTHAEHQLGPPSDSPSRIQLAIPRPDEVLNLQMSGVNLRLDTADRGSPALDVDDRGQPALLIAQFPAQTRSEQAFYRRPVPDLKQQLGPEDKERMKYEPPTEIPVDPGGLQFRPSKARLVPIRPNRVVHYA